MAEERKLLTRKHQVPHWECWATTTQPWPRCNHDHPHALCLHAPSPSTTRSCIPTPLLRCPHDAPQLFDVGFNLEEWIATGGEQPDDVP